MRSRLPQLPRRRTRWQRISRRAVQVSSLGTAQLVGGFALAYAAIAVGNSTGIPPVAVVLAIAVLAGLAILSDGAVRGRGSRRHHRNPSTDSQAHNLSNRGLSRRFRRG